MPKKIIILFCLILLLTGISWFTFKPHAKKVHYHAGFLVYVDGTLQDFSASKYMTTKPCYTNTVDRPHEDEQKEKAHLHDGVGDVVHVHRDNATWNDLFKDIEYSFPTNRVISLYIDGQLVTSSKALQYPIKSYDSIILVVGDTNKVDLNHYITVDHIKQAESKSENCGS